MNDENLIPMSKMPPERQREIARMGAQAAAEAKRKKRDLRKALEALLENEYTGKDGEKVSGSEAIAMKLFEQAMKGSVKAFETIRSTVGQDPIQKVMTAEVDPAVIDEVREMVENEQP